MAKAKQLTERQQEIVTLLDEGKTPSEVAKALEITENAVYQHIRRMRANGNKVSTSGTGGAASTRSRRSSSSRRSTPRPAPAPAATPSEPRPMTPLQAIRARKDALAHDVREADNSVAAAERALKAAQEQATKMKAKHGDELKALEKAEAAITGKPVAAKPAASKAPRDLRKTSARPAGKRSRAASKPSGNGSTPAEPQATPAPPLPGDESTEPATA